MTRMGADLCQEQTPFAWTEYEENVLWQSCPAESVRQYIRGHKEAISAARSNAHRQAQTRHMVAYVEPL